MGQKADLIAAAKAIREAIVGFVNAHEAQHVRIFESSPGHLRVIVGSDKFKSMGLTERQDLIWDYLRSKVGETHLEHCWGIHPLDATEYEEEFFPQSYASSSSMSVLQEGEEITNNDPD